MNPEQIMQKLDAIVDESAYVRHSFVTAVVDGQVDTDGLRVWAGQKYHQVFQQNRALSAIHANSPYEDVRQFEMDQLLAEETGIQDGSEAHYALMARFARAVGGPDDPDAVTMAAPVRRFVDYLVGLCLREHFVYGLLAFYINERQTPAAVSRMETYLRDVVALDDHQLEWFTLHGALDDEHAGRGRELIVKYAHEAPDFLHHAEQVVRRGCQEWTALQDFYYGLALGADAA